MASLALRLTLLLPFLLVAWVQWVRSIQQHRFERPRTTLGQRDAARALRAMQVRARQQAPEPQVERATASSPTAVAADLTPLTISETSVASASAAAPAVVARSSCPATRKPFHTVLTATAQVYQQWQCRIMYYHWKKQRANDPAGKCTELTGFTRLVARGRGEADGLENEIPSYFVHEYTAADYARFHGYRVINRPYSVVQFMKTDYWRAIKEDYVYIAETDHVMTQPLPNRASLGSPMAYIFNYMGPNPAHQSIIQSAWPAGGATGYKKVQSIGPSPVVIHRTDLEAIAKEWEQTAVALKTDPAADARLGWVIEMWGYAIAAAKLGLKHQEFPDFQVEPGALSNAAQMRGFPKRYWLFHYTYQFEYMLDGSPCLPWTIGEFSLDKRHFNDNYPAHPLPQPPAKANAAAFYLVNAFNEAMGNITAWPTHQPPSGRATQTLYGRRRLDWFSRHANGFATELRTMPIIKVWSPLRDALPCRTSDATTSTGLAPRCATGPQPCASLAQA